MSDYVPTNWQSGMGGGTPVNDVNMNHMEQGISNAHIECEAICPIGAVAFYPSSTVPSGWLECNGAAVSRSTYSTLYGILSTTYGAGDGSTTFNLPDCRGVFLRGLDEGRGYDSGRGLGTYQADSVAAHTHTITEQTVVTCNGSSGSDSCADQWVRQSANTNQNSGTESRPKNIALMVIIRYS